jgi:Asp-tRNA(Asn)/Glu-tRNA(Gln) amidotransferase A subunit family amidase
VDALAARDRMRAGLFKQMERFPVLLMPVCAVPAFRHRQREWPINGHTLNMLDIMSPATPWNLLGMPGLVVPMSITEDGLPIGVQLVAKPYDEELLLQVGAMLEQARGPFPLPPGFDE